MDPVTRRRLAPLLVAAALALPLAGCSSSQSGGTSYPDNQFSEPPAPDGVDVTPSAAAS